MAAIENTTTSAEIALSAREVDFVSRFTANWDSLREIMGIANPVRKTPGTKLAASTAKVTLQNGAVNEGDEVPLSKAVVTPKVFQDIVLKKYRKAVTAEAVSKFGAAIAVQKTDDALLNELQGEILTNFYNFALTGSLTGTESTFQMAVAMAVGKVKNKFKSLRLNYNRIVAFVNDLDAARYLGAAQITTQTMNGVEYLKNFLGAETMILTSDVPEGKVVAIPADNIVNYYIDPSDADFKELGLDYYTGNGETNLIGVHKEGNYGRVMGETHVVMGAPFVESFVFHKFSFAVFSADFSFNGHLESGFLFEDAEGGFFFFFGSGIFNFYVLFGGRSVFCGKKGFVRVVFFVGNNAVFRFRNIFCFVYGTYGPVNGHPGGGHRTEKTDRKGGIETFSCKKTAETASFVVFHFYNHLFKKILLDLFLPKRKILFRSKNEKYG